MDGTVNCARRDDGRPAFAGTAAAAATTATFSTTAGVAAVALDLEETVVCIGLADVLETGMGAGLATARGLEITGFESDEVTFVALTVLGGAAFFAVGSTVDFAPTFATGLADFVGAALAATFATGLAAGFATAFGATFATGLDDAEPLTTGFCGSLLVTFATGLAGLLGLATVLPLGLATADALVLVAAALLSFPDLAFTSCLLAEISCAWSVGPANPALLPLTGFFGGASPARECTGFALPKPIRCKIETII